MNKNLLTIVIGVVLIVVTLIGCVTYYRLNQLQAMKSNIESAIVKGIDPVAVKCSYDSGSTVCALYASRK